MSRIYDALTKAEHESALTTVTGVLDSSIRDGSSLTLADFAVHPWNLDFARLIFTDSSEEVLALEQFRSLRSRLYQLRAKQPIRTVLVCSALAGEGKTFVSANLSMALAKQSGKKVLLIDADLRKPTLHQLLGAPASPGLTEVLAGTADLADVIQSGSIENLWFLPAGTPVPDAAEVLGNKHIANVIERVMPLFDWIVVDSSPVLPVSDAVTISRSCDAVLLVARAEATPCDAVQRAQHEFREARVLGLVLNAATKAPRHGSYDYPHYGQGKHGGAPVSAKPTGEDSNSRAQG